MSERLVDDVVDVFVAEGVSHCKENALLTNNPRLELAKQVGIGRSETRSSVFAGVG